MGSRARDSIWDAVVGAELAPMAITDTALLPEDQHLLSTSCVPTLIFQPWGWNSTHRGDSDPPSPDLFPSLLEGSPLT